MVCLISNEKSWFDIIQFTCIILLDIRTSQESQTYWLSYSMSLIQNRILSALQNYTTFWFSSLVYGLVRKPMLSLAKLCWFMRVSFLNHNDIKIEYAFFFVFGVCLSRFTESTFFKIFWLVAPNHGGADSWLIIAAPIFNYSIRPWSVIQTFIYKNSKTHWSFLMFLTFL